MAGYTHKDFAAKLAIIQPELKVVKVINGANNNIVVEDKYGVLYKTSSYSLLHGKHPKLSSAINKVDGFKKRYGHRNQNVKLIGEFKNCQTKLKVEDKFGVIHFISYNQFINGDGAGFNSAIDPTELFIAKSKFAHGNKYDYSKSIYIGAKKKLLIKCNKCNNEFWQNEDNHRNGNGCPKCNKSCGYSKTKWISKCGSNFVSFYIIKCFNDTEAFYKAGITGTKLNQRYSSKLDMPYNYKVVNLSYHSSPDAYDLEKAVKKNNKSIKYNPIIKFDGCTECFNSIPNYATHKSY